MYQRLPRQVNRFFQERGTPVKLLEVTVFIKIDGRLWEGVAHHTLPISSVDVEQILGNLAFGIRHFLSGLGPTQYTGACFNLELEPVETAGEDVPSRLKHATRDGAAYSELSWTQLLPGKERRDKYGY